MRFESVDIERLLKEDTVILCGRSELVGEKRFDIEIGSQKRYN